MRYALIDNNAVVNVILVADVQMYPVPNGMELLSIDDRPEVCVGWSREGDEWVDSRPVPEVEPLTVEDIEALRLEAYRNESDPLYFMEKAGEIAEGTWLAKRAEIRARYPYPEGIEDES